MAVVWQKLAIAIQGRVARDTRGSSLVEYVLLVMLVAVACLVALNILGGNTSDSYSQFASAIDTP